MTRDPLKSVLRLRRMVLDEATQEFAECLRKETESSLAVTAIETAIARETETAASLSGGDATVEAFGAWFRRARQELRAATLAHERTQAETVRARAVMAAAGAAVEAAEAVQTGRTAERDRQEAHREQGLLDEAVLRRR